MAMTSVPNAGGDAVPGGYPAPTPHAAAKSQHVYEAPSSVPSDHPPVSESAGFDAVDGLGDANLL